MAQRYKVGIAFEFEPQGEHDFLFEGMDKGEIKAHMIGLVTEDILNGNGMVEILSVEEYEENN